MAKDFVPPSGMSVKKDQRLQVQAPKKVLAINPHGHGVRLHCDYHDVSFRERYREAGFLFPDEYQTPVQKEELDKLIAQRLNVSESKRIHRAALSPDGRKKFENVALYQGVFNEQFNRFMETVNARTKHDPADALPPPPVVERKPGEKR